MLVAELCGTYEVIAVDGSTGSVRSRHATGFTGGQTAGFNAVVAGDVVGMGDLDVYAFDRCTGDVLWQYPPTDDTPSEYASTAIPDGDRIYVAGYHGSPALQDIVGTARRTTPGSPCGTRRFCWRPLRNLPIRARLRHGGRCCFAAGVHRRNDDSRRLERPVHWTLLRDFDDLWP